MKRETLFHHQCTAIASQHGLGGLYELAQHLHLEKGIRRGDETIHMDHSDDPTSTSAFWFSPAAGECGVIVATVGASHEENGLEGARFLFQPHEATAAQAALLSEMRSMDTDAATTEVPAFTVV